MILKCVARCRCSGKVAQEKVDCLYTRLSSHEDAEWSNGGANDYNYQ